MDWFTAFLLSVVALFVLMGVGVPIAGAMGLVGFTGLALVASPHVAIKAVAMLLYSTPLNFVLIAIPMFILMAEVSIFSGFATRLFDAAEKVLGGLPGGLLLSVIGASTVFAAISGSSVASCATIGSAALPEMTRRGYNRVLAVGSVAAGGGLAIIIPPSILFILYGFILEISVARMFIAGVIPGLMMAAGYSVWAISVAYRRPEQVPRIVGVTWSERGLAVGRSWPLVALAFMVMGSIYLGFATVTESAAMGVLGALLLSILYRRFSIPSMRQALLATAQTTGFIILIIVGALMFGFLMSYLKAPARLTAFVVELGLSPILILIGVNLLFLVLGCIMDSVSIILVAVPVIAPALMKLGFNPIWLGIILCINIEMGLTTPPVGMNLFVLQGVGKPYGITYADIVRGAFPYLMSDATTIALVMAFPSLALWLPNLMRGG